MILTTFRPDIILQILPENQGWMFKSTETKCYSIFDSFTHKLKNCYSPMIGPAIRPALLFETSLMPSGDLFPSPMSSGDVHDTTKVSHTTGGGRRSFTSVAFANSLSPVQSKRETGLSGLLSWARDQGNRPVCWEPFNFNYDAYYGVIGPDHKNPIHKYDSVDQSGWDIFDPAHLESSALFSGSAVGLDECLHHFTTLLMWVVSTFPGKSTKSKTPLKGWHGSKQPRACGWMIWYLTRAILLGFDTADQEFIDKFLAGHRPKDHLIAYLNELITPDFLPLGGEVADERTMVVIGAINGISQIRGSLTFQWCILFAAIGYLLRTNILNDPLKAKVRDWVDHMVEEVEDRAITADGMAYSFSRDNNFTDDDLVLANGMEKDPGHIYERVNGVIRDTPRVADCEMMAGALALLYGKTDTNAVLMSELCPIPGASAYKPKATYLDVFYGVPTI